MEDDRPCHPARDAEQRIIATAARLPDADRRALLAWTRALLALRASDAPPLARARRALSLENAAGVLRPVVRATGRALADAAWTDRSWAERLGVGAATLAGAAAAGQGAAVAAAGAGVAVPLWIVLGSGDGFAAALRDALERSLAAVSPVGDEEGPVVEAEWEFAEDDGPAPDGREPLWRVFRRAYREARARQRVERGG